MGDKNTQIHTHRYKTQYKEFNSVYSLNIFLNEIGEDVISVMSEYVAEDYETKHYVHYKVYPKNRVVKVKVEVEDALD